MYMIAIYEELLAKSSESRRGLSKQECRNLLLTLPAPVGDEGSLAGPFENRRLNELIRRGWLLLRYDDTEGEYMVMLPDYSKRMMDVIILLKKDDPLKKISMYGLYSSIYTFTHDRFRDIQGLEAAEDMAKSLSLSIHSACDRLQHGFSELLALVDQNLLVQGVLKIFDAEERGESSRFQQLCTEAKNALNDDMKARQRDMDKADPSGTEYRNMLSVYQRMRDLIKEIDSIEELYQNYSRIQTNSLQRLRQKFEYMNGRNTEADRANLLKLVSYLSEDLHNGNHDLVRLAAKRMTFVSCAERLIDRPFWTPRTAEKKVYERLVTTEEDIKQQKGEYNLTATYKDEELNAFRRKLNKHGKICADKGSVRDREDVEKLFYIFFENGITAKDHRIIGQAVLDGETEFPILSWTEPPKEDGND